MTDAAPSEQATADDAAVFGRKLAAWAATLNEQERLLLQEVAESALRGASEAELAEVRGYDNIAEPHPPIKPPTHLPVVLAQLVPSPSTPLRPRGT